jgi:hypothetical protein
MATKKKSFDAVAASWRWRVQSGRRLATMMPAKRRVHLQRVTEEFFSGKPDIRTTSRADR